MTANPNFKHYRLSPDFLDRTRAALLRGAAEGRRVQALVESVGCDREQALKLAMDEVNQRFAKPAALKMAAE